MRRSASPSTPADRARDDAVPAPRSAPGRLGMLVAVPVHALTLALAALGAWLLWPGTNVALHVVGVLALALCWAVLPLRRGDDARSAAGAGARWNVGAVRSLRRWEDLLSPYRPAFPIASEHQVLLHAGGGDHVLAGNGGGGLLADVASLVLAPPRLLATAYRRLLERTVSVPSRGPTGASRPRA